MKIVLLWSRFSPLPGLIEFHFLFFLFFLAPSHSLLIAVSCFSFSEEPICWETCFALLFVWKAHFFPALSPPYLDTLYFWNLSSTYYIIYYWLTSVIYASSFFAFFLYLSSISWWTLAQSLFVVRSILFCLRWTDSRKDLLNSNSLSLHKTLKKEYPHLHVWTKMICIIITYTLPLFPHPLPNPISIF